MDIRRATRATWLGFVALAVAALLATPAAAAANDSEMGGAGMSVKPITSTTIRMAAETVQVVAFGQYAEYQVDFQFENTGLPQHVKLGFPFPVPVADEPPGRPPAAFRAWQGDKELAVTYQVIDEGDFSYGYYLHWADFPTGTTMIRVRYYAYPDTAAGTPPDNVKPPERFAGAQSYLGFYPYTVSTGAGWAGNIGASVIRYYVSPDAQMWGIDEAAQARAAQLTPDWAPKDAAKTLLSYTSPATGVYEWRFIDYEPMPNEDGFSSYDIELPFYIPSSADAAVPKWAPYSSVKASSALKLGGFSYPAEQAVDGDPSTAWAEAAPGSGIGQSLTVTFPASRDVREIRLLPGYAKTEALFRKYNRPKTLSVEFSDGTRTQLALTDDPDVQRFPVNAGATWAKVTIADVYRGTTRDETYLSEIEFGTEKAPQVMAFQDVLDGKVPALPEAGGAPGASGAASASATLLRFPAGWRNLGWPLVACCVGCGVLLGLVVGVVLVVVARRRKITPSTNTTGPEN